VGSHFWNIQDELRNRDSEEIDVNRLLYTSEFDGKSVSYPRALIFDIKGSLGTLQGAREKITNLEDILTPSWSGSKSLHKAEPIEKNQFLQALEETESKKSIERRDFGLDDQVSIWSDFLSVRFHPRTIHEIFSIQESTDSLDHYLSGCEIVKSFSETWWEEILDNARYLAEQSDTLSGLQQFVDVQSDKFSALSTHYVTSLMDTILSPKTPLLTFALSPPSVGTATKEVKMNTITTAFSMSTLSEISSFYLPLSLSSSSIFPELNLSIDKPFHTSAVLAAAIDTATLPFRLKRDDLDVRRFINQIIPTPSRKIAALSASLPFPLSGQRQKELQQHLVSLTPGLEIHGIPFSECEVIRGSISRNLPTAMFSQFGPRFFVSQEFPVPISFPRFFNIGDNAESVKSTPMLTYMHTTPALYRSLKTLSTNFHQFVTTSLGSNDEMQENVEQLLSLADSYHTS